MDSPKTAVLASGREKAPWALGFTLHGGMSPDRNTRGRRLVHRQARHPVPC